MTLSTCGPCRHGLHSQCENDMCGAPVCGLCEPCHCPDNCQHVHVGDAITVADYDALDDTQKRLGRNVKPIDQTKFGPGEGGAAGNCMQAAVASLLEMSLDDVPHFAAVGVKGDTGSWWHPFVVWCRSIGLHPVVHEAAIGDAVGLMSGPSPRGTFWHLVVSLGDDVLHDPHPSRDGLADGEREWWYMTPLDIASNGWVRATYEVSS